MIRTLSWSGMIIIYYVVFSLLFDTPYEFYMKRSSERLRSEYASLQGRLDSLEVVIEDIERRDNNVFNIMFESSPYDLSADHSSKLRKSLMSMTETELLEELERRSETFYVGADDLVDSTHEMMLAIKSQGNNISKIPAIQPVANRQLTLLTASFGERMHPFYKTIHKHNGVDYTVPEGSRVFATADGVVKSYTLQDSPSGKSVLIDHGNGYESYYAHLKRIDIPRNRRVKRGDIIGASGNTGLSLTPHLHYEIRYKGVPVNPINYFFLELSVSQSQQIAHIAESGMQSFD